MSDSGYIDWHRLAQGWTDTGEGGTFVYAFWLADYARSRLDHGVTLLKPEGAHPDWFIHADGADGVLFSVSRDEHAMSPNLSDVYDTHLTSLPVLGSLCLGTSTGVWADPRRSGYWWCAYPDLTRQGRKLVKQVSALYERRPAILTFLNLSPMRPADPGAGGDSATVAKAPGHTT